MCLFCYLLKHVSTDIIGFVSCCVWSGKNSVPRVQMMIERGADIIAMPSCIPKGNPIGYACSHFETMRNALKKLIKDKG